MNCRDHARGDGGLHDGQETRPVKDLSQPRTQSIALRNENQVFNKWLEVSGKEKGITDTGNSE